MPKNKINPLVFLPRRNFKLEKNCNQHETIIIGNKAADIIEIIECITKEIAELEEGRELIIKISH